MTSEGFSPSACAPDVPELPPQAVRPRASVAAAARTLDRPVKNRFMLSAYLLINMSSSSLRRRNGRDGSLPPRPAGFRPFPASHAVPGRSQPPLPPLLLLQKTLLI